MILAVWGHHIASGKYVAFNSENLRIALTTRLKFTLIESDWSPHFSYEPFE